MSTSSLLGRGTGAAEPGVGLVLGVAVEDDLECEAVTDGRSDGAIETELRVCSGL